MPIPQHIVDQAADAVRAKEQPFSIAVGAVARQHGVPFHALQAALTERSAQARKARVLRKYQLSGQQTLPLD